MKTIGRTKAIKYGQLKRTKKQKKQKKAIGLQKKPNQKFVIKSPAADRIGLSEQKKDDIRVAAQFYSSRSSKESRPNCRPFSVSPD
ncbi:MAG: hypothetical protein LBJ64_09935 [Deltaproteobacteria bacterium]|jgi:hypothetical protein|nr:hypothetical protein [Deltaproteobacteria bacterium]